MADLYFHPTGSDLTTTSPAVTDTLKWVDRDPSNGSVAYTGTVPSGAPYQLRGPIPLSTESTITATIGGASRTVIEGDSAGTGQIAVNRQSGVWTFDSADASGALSVTMTAWASPIAAEILEWFQDKDNERVVGPGTVTDNAVPRFNGTTGYIIQTSNATLNDGGELVLEYDGGNADHEALEIYHENGAAQTTVGVGQRIAYYGRNDAAAKAGGSYFEHEWVDTGAGSEQGEFNFGLINGGGISTPFTIGAEDVAINGTTTITMGTGTFTTGGNVTLSTGDLTITAGDLTVTAGTISGDGSGITNLTLDSDLDAVAALATNGIAVRVSAGSWTTRTITSGSGTALVVTNGDGTAANPVISLGANLTALHSGTIDNVVIGGSTPAAGNFTALGATGTVTAADFDINEGTYAITLDHAASMTDNRTAVFPNRDGDVVLVDGNNAVFEGTTQNLTISLASLTTARTLTAPDSAGTIGLDNQDNDLIDDAGQVTVQSPADVTTGSVLVGDTEGNGNSTLLEVDDADKRILLQGQCQLKTFTDSITFVGDDFKTENGAVNVWSSAGSTTLTSTPTIDTTFARDGQIIILINNGANTITIQDEANLAGSKLQMGGVDKALAPEDSVMFVYSSTTTFWHYLGGTV